MPFMPRVTDKAEMVEELFSGLSDVGVDAVMPGGMTLRPGCQKDHFLILLNPMTLALYLFTRIFTMKTKCQAHP